jgi:hypothetical protein
MVAIRIVFFFLPFFLLTTEGLLGFEDGFFDSLTDFFDNLLDFARQACHSYQGNQEADQDWDRFHQGFLYRLIFQRTSFKYNEWTGRFQLQYSNKTYSGPLVPAAW